MASGFKYNGTDLDSIFKARTTSATADTGFLYNDNGTYKDLSNKYEKIAYSPQQEITYNTRFITNKTGYTNKDLRYIFVDLNY